MVGMSESQEHNHNHHPSSSSLSDKTRVPPPAHSSSSSLKMDLKLLVSPSSYSTVPGRSSHHHNHYIQQQQQDDSSFHPQTRLSGFNEDVNGSRRNSHGFSLNALLDHRHGGGDFYAASPPPSQLQLESHNLNSNSYNSNSNNNSKSFHFDRDWTGVVVDVQSEMMPSRDYTMNNNRGAVVPPLAPSFPSLKLGNSSLNSIANVSNHHHHQQPNHRHHPYFNTYVRPQRSSFDASQGSQYSTIDPTSVPTYTSVLTRRNSAPVAGTANLGEVLSPLPYNTNRNIIYPSSASLPPPVAVTMSNLIGINQPHHPIDTSRPPPPLPLQPLHQESTPSVSFNAKSINIEQQTETETVADDNCNSKINDPRAARSPSKSSHSEYNDVDDDGDGDYNDGVNDDKKSRRRRRRTATTTTTTNQQLLRRNTSTASSSSSSSSSITALSASSSSKHSKKSNGGTSAVGPSSKIKCTFPSCRGKFNTV